MVGGNAFVSIVGYCNQATPQTVQVGYREWRGGRAGGSVYVTKWEVTASPAYHIGVAVLVLVLHTYFLLREAALAT